MFYYYFPFDLQSNNRQEKIEVLQILLLKLTYFELYQGVYNNDRLLKCEQQRYENILNFVQLPYIYQQMT